MVNGELISVQGLLERICAFMRASPKPEFPYSELYENQAQAYRAKFRVKFDQAIALLSERKSWNDIMGDKNSKIVIFEFNFAP